MGSQRDVRGAALIGAPRDCQEGKGRICPATAWMDCSHMLHKPWQCVQFAMQQPTQAISPSSICPLTPISCSRPWSCSSAQLAASNELGALRFLMTTRTPLQDASSGVQERRVGAISYIAACEVVASIAEDLTDEEAGQVAMACHCVPLYLRLVAEALVAGRMALEVRCRSLPPHAARCLCSQGQQPAFALHGFTCRRGPGQWPL